MTKKNKPLPRPAKTPFGKRRGEPEESQELMADKMAEAAALGKLDEFISQEMPDSEHARKLAEMMMGMTGMTMQAGISSIDQNKEASAGEAPVSEDVRRAVQDGDVQGLMGLLRKEHQKRSPDAMQEVTAPQQASAVPEGMPTIDRELIDALVAVAKDNSVTLDWIILRAIKVYVEEYRKTGKL